MKTRSRSPSRPTTQARHLDRPGPGLRRKRLIPTLAPPEETSPAHAALSAGVPIGLGPRLRAAEGFQNLGPARCWCRGWSALGASPDAPFLRLPLVLGCSAAAGREPAQ